MSGLAVDNDMHQPKFKRFNSLFPSAAFSFSARKLRTARTFIYISIFVTLSPQKRDTPPCFTYYHFHRNVITRGCFRGEKR